VEQFAYLNVAWALAIVVLEVPSGALADQFGRRTLVVAAAVLMLVEMVVICLAPVVDPTAHAGDPEALNRSVWLLFVVFCVNRVISGAAEAAASGADEALAYDSLKEEGREARWSRLTVRLIKWQSIGFIAVTLVGAAVYDPDVVNRVAGWLGMDHRFTQSETLKFPLYLNLVTAVATLVVALRFYEPPASRSGRGLPLGQAMGLSFRRVFQAGGWILRTPAALMLILVGLFYDSIIRLYYTVGSIWLEVIGYAPRHFGIISVAGSLTGIGAAMLGARLMERRMPGFNFRLVSLLVFVGLFSLAFPIHYWSVVFLPALWLAMRLLHLFLSNYLNRFTPSENRATILSFRGLTMNLSFGVVMGCYALQTVLLRSRAESANVADFSESARAATVRAIFSEAVSWWWVYFLVVVAGLAIYRRVKIGKSWNELLAPPENPRDDNAAG